MYINKKAKWAIFFGLVPALLIYIVMAIIPMGISLYMSFFEWNGLSDMKFIGFDNFNKIFSDSKFWNSLWNNLIIIMVGLFITIPLGLGMALLLNQKIKGIKFYRMALFLPVVISAVVISLIWSFVYSADNGLINSILSAVGLGSLTQNWLGDPSTALLSVSVAYVWSNFGLFMVIFLAAIQTVPKEIIEAARIDGANGWQRTWKVIIPSIKETLIVAIVFSVSSSFRAFDLMYVMTGGGPAHHTEIMTVYMYQNTFEFMRFGLGSAISIVITLISLIVILLIQYFANRDRNKIRKSLNIEVS